MKKFVIAVFGFMTIVFYSCKDDDAERIDDPIDGEVVELTYNFESSSEGWDAGLAGILAAEEADHEFKVDHVQAPYDENTNALMLSATNPNNNLFIYTTRQIAGLEPNTNYEINYSVRFASVIAIDSTATGIDTTGTVVDTTGIISDTTGVNTDTTDYVSNVNDTIVIKAGAINTEPVVEEDASNYLQLVGIDVGEPGADGSDLVVLGSFVADTTDNNVTLHTASTENPVSVTTNEDGELWLIIGKELYGTKTDIYIDRIEVEVRR